MAEREPRYAARLMKPFLALVAEHPSVNPDLVQRYGSLDPEERVPAATALRMLEAAVALTGNEDLGLDAAMQLSLGDWDLLEYAANTCETFGDALEVTGRYIDLVNESVTYRLDRDEQGGRFWIVSELEQCRAAIDFQLACVYRVALNWRGRKLLDGIEIHFSYPEPARTSRHDEVFAGAPLRFGQPHDAMILPARLLDMHLSSADRGLNEVLRRHADRLQASLVDRAGFTGNVRRLILESLPSGRATVELIAARLDMSRRTLLRKLDREGTTFKQLLDDTRRELSLRYLENGQLSAAEVGLLLGFAQPAAFHRAFKRWTGETPLAYQRSVRLSGERGVNRGGSASVPPARGDGG